VDGPLHKAMTQTVALQLKSAERHFSEKTLEWKGVHDYKVMYLGTLKCSEICIILTRFLFLLSNHLAHSKKNCFIQPFGNVIGVLANSSY